MSGLRPSECRTQMLFVEDRRVLDEQGGVAAVPSPIATVWGKLMAPNGREAWISDQLRTEVEFVFKCRLVPAIKSKHRCNTADGRQLEVLSAVVSDDDPRWMVCALRQYQDRATADAGA